MLDANLGSPKRYKVRRIIYEDVFVMSDSKDLAISVARSCPCDTRRLRSIRVL